MTSEAKDMEILRREYRNMELNRKTFVEESNSILRKQQQSLDKLRMENENLKTDVATLQARTTMKPLNSFEQGQLDKVTLEIERYKHTIELERSNISNIEKQMTLLREKIWQQRKMMGGTNAAAENQRTVEKQVKILENRLDQALVKFNKSLANNRKLREEIDNLRGERVAFDSVYKKLEKGLQDRKRQMAQVIEQSNFSYEQRDKSRMEILAISQTNKKEQEIFDRHMEDMGRKLEEEIKAAAERRKSQQPKNTISEEESKAAAEKAAKASALLKEKQAIAEQRREKIQHFEEAFRKIATATGVTDVDELVKTFTSNDEQNFSLFTYANEQSNEIDNIEDQVQILQKEKSNYVNNEDDTNQYEQTLQEFEARIETAKVQAENNEEKSIESLLILESLKDGIKMMITRLDCNGDNTGDLSVNEANMLQFLGVIEEHTNQVLNDYYLIRVHENIERGRSNESDSSLEPVETKLQCVLGVGPKMPMAADSMNVNPPKLLDYSSDENSTEDNDVGTRPLKLDEVKSKISNRINQQRRKGPNTDSQTNGRRGSIFSRRRSLLAANAATIMAKRRSTISINNVIR